ncbi:MAG: type I DNA topoisomerase [bacterium]
MKNLVIVESPTKAKTISKFLGKEYKILSSFGHIRDLPKSKMGIDIDNDFAPQYVIPAKAKRVATELKKEAASANKIILASDEDREGEAISWHLLELFGASAEKKYQRIVFHEITKKAIEEALKNPRKLDMNLVDAQQARRILDRLVGYELSPFLWRKVAKGLSAGRVQSVAVRLIVEREREIENFKTDEYWTIEGIFKKINSDEKIKTKLDKIDGKKLEKLSIGNGEDAEKILAKLKNLAYKVADIQQKQTQKNPYPPFTTSTLQQEANKKLGFSSKQTMVIAQQLYEGIELEDGSSGLITYMRTDSLNIAKEAIENIRDIIKNTFGENYLPKAPSLYKTKSKGAQEAHEAIRPAYPEKTPESILKYLDKNQFKLYDLIWCRAIACQMMPAIINNTTVDIENNNSGKNNIYTFRANGSIIKFDGFLKVYPTQTEENILPIIEKDEDIKAIEIKPFQHFTQPPARYTEASLIKILEEYGIGRPSTYAPTVDTIQKRNYVIKEDDKKLHPTEIGIMVNDILVQHFNDIVDYQFTAKMENDLDEIADAGKKWQPVIKEFYFPFKENLNKKDKELNKKEITEEKTDEICSKCGSPMIIKTGRFGKFMACSNYPECKNTKPMPGEEEPQETEKIDEKCPECGAELILKHGRFGKFIGCSNYPKCKYIKKQTISTGIKCPLCKEGEIIEKKSRKGKFYACNRYPDCKFALWYKPTGEKCPRCGSLMITKVTKKDGEIIVCSNKECKK